MSDLSTHTHRWRGGTAAVLILVMASMTAGTAMAVAPPPLASLHYTLDAGAARLDRTVQGDDMAWIRTGAEPLIRLGARLSPRWVCSGMPPARNPKASLRVWMAPSHRRGDPEGTWRGRVVVETLTGYTRVSETSPCWKPAIKTTLDTAVVLVEGASAPVAVAGDAGAPFGRVVFSARVFMQSALPGSQRLQDSTKGPRAAWP